MNELMAFSTWMKKKIIHELLVFNRDVQGAGEGLFANRTILAFSDIHNA